MALLTHLTVRVSGIIEGPIDDVWEVVRRFGSVSDWLHPVEGLSNVKSQLLPGFVEGQIGGLRVVSIGLSSYVEQLECLDEEQRTMKWKLISHHLNTNPFPATFLNFKSAIQLMEVTRERATFMVWTADFDTDFEGAEAMRSEIATRLETGFEGLSAMLFPKLSSSSLCNNSTPNGGSRAIGSVAIPGVSNSMGGTSPPAQKPAFPRHAGTHQALAGEIPALRYGQQADSLASQAFPQLPSLPSELSGSHGAGPPDWQDAVPLGHVNGNSFTFSGFARTSLADQVPTQKTMESPLRFPLPIRDGHQQPAEELDPVRAFIQQGLPGGTNLPHLASVDSQSSLQQRLSGRQSKGPDEPSSPSPLASPTART